MAAVTSSTTIPAGLEKTIHRALGPGPIGLGTAPLLSGIARTASGWSALASHQGVSGSISRSGLLLVSLENKRLTGTLMAWSIGSGADPTAMPLHVTSSSLVGGKLVQKAGPLTTSYQVTPAGLEQSFTIVKAPAGLDGTLVVDLGPASGWAAAGNGTSLVKRGANGLQSLLYGGLKSRDRTGAVLASEMRIMHGSAQIVVHGVRASSFPLDIDPTWSTSSVSVATLNNSGGNAGDFGYSVALSADGTTAVVGAPFVNSGDGAVYVFHVSSEESWATSSTPTATLTNPGENSVSNSWFGISVALSADGTTAVIGADSVSSYSGATSVFHVSSEESWATSSTPTVTLADPGGVEEAGDFGSSVAISADGTTAVIGAEGEILFGGEGIAISTGGAAYVFHVSSEESWATASTPTAVLTNLGEGSESLFGSSVALSADGTTAVIGAFGVSSNTGAAYVFHVSSEDSWATSLAPTAILTNSSGAADDYFGSSVALSADGTAAVIGAYGVNSYTGAAYVFQVSSEQLWATASTPTATLTNWSGAVDDYFGSSVAISPDGTTALIGAEDVSSNTGAAYVFHVSGEESWLASSTPTATLTNSGGASDDQFGASVTLSGDGTVAIIGSPGVSSYGGAAYVFNALATPSAPTITNLPASGTYEGGFTATVSTTGDGATSVTSNSTSICTASGLAVSYVGVGTCSLTAQVAAGADYSAASGTAQTFSVGPATPSTPFIFNLPPSGTDGGGFTARVSTTGDGATSVTSNSTSICTASGLAVSYVGVGTCSLTAQVAAGADYSAASGTAQTFSIGPAPRGYWLVGSDGGIFSFGSALFHGSTGNLQLNRPVVGITPTSDLGGYWLVASDGGIFSFGDSGFYGSIPGLGLAPAGTVGGEHLNAPIVGMVPSYNGGGYFMVGSDGGVFSFGDAEFEGSCPGIGGCSGPAVAVAPDATGKGYWLVTQTGQVYTFGDAPHLGAPGPQSSAITSMVRTPSGNGYWILDAGGQVFGYGNAANLGGPVGVGGLNPASAIFATSDGGGYWVATANGAVYTYGDAPYDGGMNGTHLNGSIIAGTGF